MAFFFCASGFHVTDASICVMLLSISACGILPFDACSQMYLLMLSVGHIMFGMHCCRCLNWLVCLLFVCSVCLFGVLVV